MELTIRLLQSRGVVEGKKVYDTTQTAYNIANVLDGHVGDASSATKMVNNAPICVLSGSNVCCFSPLPSMLNGS